MTGKIIGTAFCFIALIFHADAQGFGVELDGGLQGMKYTLQNGQTKILPGGSVGVNYGIGLGGGLSLLTGVTGGVYRTQATLQDGRITYDEVDESGSAFEYNLKYTGYKEIQRFYALSIPVLLQYHTDGASVQWCIDGGGKVFIPFGTNIAVSAEQLSLSGYYPDLNLEVTNLPQHGFGTTNNFRSNANAQLKPSAALSAGTGLSFALGGGVRLYAGVYIDLGLTDLKKSVDSMPLMTYGSGGVNEVHANSVLNMRNTGPAKLFSAGLQMRLSFGSSKRHKASAADSLASSAATPLAVAAPPPVPVPARSADSSATQAATPPPAETPVATNPTPTHVPMVPSAMTYDEVDLIQTPVLFGTIRETSIPELQREHLDEVAEILNKYPSIRISIVGHICGSGTETEDPKKVGLGRAIAIARYLRAKGIDKKRMDVSVAKQADPVDPIDQAADYRNRRAEIAIE